MEPAQKILKKIGKYAYEPSSVPLKKTAFGDIYQGYNADGGLEAPVVITVVPVTILDTPEKDQMFKAGLAALKTISTLGLNQIVQLKNPTGETPKTANNYYLITERYNGKSLESMVQDKTKLSEEFVLDIIKRVAQVFDSVENQGIKDDGETVVLLHRNIKANNIVFHDGKAKLAGFGFSQLIKKSTTSSQRFVGTPLYMSPQILNMMPYTNKCDVWSLGVVAYTAICGKKPWVAKTERLLLQTIKETPLIIPEEVSNETGDLLTQMLQYDEERRISWKDILDHPALKKSD